ncbi:hypothetical protein M409DRAFT_61689 [Zasmidium cellare ATCC 36951]|uniref:Actin-like ATPase domain-containing protein n=1 Tax=Zasmidium cellare ATCC 36951 TaxID=1080233 RepID=A0A6A6BUB8_ZASCE|nr:uncharacterized protein M409DRAFT_61689 [Zasmidium cellare ATCC 36951]KAF2158397.1 hypothetical protein M409DRAFT_61689 [Zasmidium cellare ATCC 36951]
MAKIKFVRPHKQKDANPHNEAARGSTRSYLAMELGGSHAAIGWRSDTEHWRPLRWTKSTGASSLGGVEVIPTTTAVRVIDQSQAPGLGRLEFRHGHDAMNARMQSSTWTVFTHLKLALIDAKPPTEGLQKALDLEDKDARALGCTIKDIALAFFEDVLKHAVAGLKGHVTMYVNIVESWPREVAQRLIRCFERMLPHARFEVVDEAFAGIVGCMSERRHLSAASRYVVVDGGHSTMTIGCGVDVGKSSYKVTKHDTFDAGAGRITADFEDELRVQGVDDPYHAVQHAEEYFKADADAELDPPNLPLAKWTAALARGRESNAALDTDRIALMNKTITEEQTESGQQEVMIIVIVTGRALRSKTFRRDVEKFVKRAGVTIHYADDTECTAVMKGLRTIADDPSILDVDVAPLSVWLRSEPDDSHGGAESNAVRVIRVVKKGQSLSGKDTTRRKARRTTRKAKATRLATDSSKSITPRRDARYPVEFDLKFLGAGDDPDPRLEIDLSVYGTRADLSEEETRQGTDDDLFDYTTSDMVVPFGDLRRTLPLHKDSYVYVFVRMKMFATKFEVVYAEDGHQLPKLGTTPFSEVVRNDTLSADWRARHGVNLKLMQVGQITRPETLVAAHARETVTDSPSRRWMAPGA